MNPEDLAPARLPFPVTRAVATPVESRATEGAAMPTMVGHFSTFGDPYEVHSMLEGHFIERIAPGAFNKTIRESRSQMKVLYDHGQDPTIGNKVLGPIDDLRVDATGPAFVVPMFDTNYNRELAPGIEAGVYGVSFRFSVEKDEWDQSPARSTDNPDGLPERTITEARVFEFGPVTFPANPAATVGVRSTTDTFYKRSRDPEQFEELLRSAQLARTPVRTGAAAVADEPPVDTPVEEPSHPDTPRAEPPPDVAAIADTDPPEGGSSDSRSKHVEFTNREDMVSRASELEEAIKRQAVAFVGELPTDEQARYDTDKKELVDLQRNIDAWDARQADLVKLVRSGGAGDEPRTPYNAPELQRPIIRKSEKDIYSFETRDTSFDGRLREFRDDAMRINDITHFGANADEARTRDRIATLLDHHDSKDKEFARRMKATGSPTYARAFEKIIKGGASVAALASLTPEEQRGTALAVGVDGTGGFAIPFAFDPSVIAIGVHGGAINPYRATCRVVDIVGTDTWNALTATAVTATRTTEAAPAIEQGPTFAQPQYIVKRVQGQITASFETFQDRTDLASEMGKLIQEAKDNEEETSWATGAGSGSASIGVGPVTGTSGAYTNGTATAGSGVIAAGDADATEAALPVRHRFGAQWYMNRTNIRKFQSVETAGGKLFQQSQWFQSAGNVDLSRDGNTGLRLLGYPVNESPSLPTATTTTITIGTLLNPQSFVIVDRVGMSVQFIPFIFNSSALATGQQALYFLYRNHAAPINVDAGRVLRFV